MERQYDTLDVCPAFECLEFKSSIDPIIIVRNIETITKYDYNIIIALFFRLQ